MDTDPGMVVTAAALVPEAEFHVAGLLALPFGDQQFDVVLANFVINHVGQPRATLAGTELIPSGLGNDAVSPYIVTS